MDSVYKKFFNTNNHKAILLCGLFLFSLFFLIGIVNSEESKKQEINIEEVEIQKNELKKEIEKVENEIEKVNEDIKKTQQKVRTFKNEISIYNNSIYKNELEIKETKLSVKQSGLEIGEIKNKIKEGEVKNEQYRKSLKNLLRILYLYDQNSIFDVLIVEDNISDFLNKVDAVDATQDKVSQIIIDFKSQKEELILKNKNLLEQQEEEGDLIQMIVYQNEEINNIKIEKNKLLEITEGEENKFQQLLEENKNILPFLKTQLYDLQSLGQKIEFDDAFSASEYASSVTGVRQEFILAIFQVETRWGAFKGTGNWEDDMYKCYLRLADIFPANKSYYLKRAETEKKAFFSVVEKLNLDPNSVKLSAEPAYGCGGAMGFAQFIPSTWISYEERVSAVTGHYPVSPWNLADSLVAMAVKLSDIAGVTDGKYDAEREAAGRYHGGGRWYKKQSSIKYANDVMIWAKLYEEELQ